MFIVNGFEVEGDAGLVQLLDLAMREVQRSFGGGPPGGLRGSQYRVLAMVPRDGSRRLTDLASVADMTKQAMGEFAAALAAGGYLDITTDPEDRRARLVSLTARGREAADEAAGHLSRVERLWAERLGAADLARLDELLARVAGIS